MPRENRPVTIRGSFYKDKKVPVRKQGTLNRILFSGKFVLNGVHHDTSILQEEKYKHGDCSNTPENASRILMQEAGIDKKLSDWAQNNIDFSAGPIGQYVTDLQNKFLTKNFMIKMVQGHESFNINTQGRNSIHFSVDMPYIVMVTGEDDEEGNPKMIGDEQNYALRYRAEIQATIVKGKIIAKILKDEAECLHEDLKNIFVEFKQQYEKKDRPNLNDIMEKIFSLEDNIKQNLSDGRPRSFFTNNLIDLKNHANNTYQPDCKEIYRSIVTLENQFESMMLLDNLIKACRKEMEDAAEQNHPVRTAVEAVFVNITNKLSKYEVGMSCFQLRDNAVMQLRQINDSLTDNDPIKRKMEDYINVFENSLNYFALSQQINQLRVEYNIFLQQVSANPAQHKEGTNSTKYLAKTIKMIEKSMEKNDQGQVPCHIALKDQLKKTLEKSLQTDLLDPKFPTGHALKKVFEDSLKRIDQVFPASYNGQNISAGTASTNEATGEHAQPRASNFKP